MDNPAYTPNLAGALINLDRYLVAIDNVTRRRAGATVSIRVTVPDLILAGGAAEVGVRLRTGVDTDL